MYVCVRVCCSLTVWWGIAWAPSVFSWKEQPAGSGRRRTLPGSHKRSCKDQKQPVPALFELERFWYVTLQFKDWLKMEHKPLENFQTSINPTVNNSFSDSFKWFYMLDWFSNIHHAKRHRRNMGIYTYSHPIIANAGSSCRSKGKSILKLVLKRAVMVTGRQRQAQQSALEPKQCTAPPPPPLCLLHLKCHEQAQDK